MLLLMAAILSAIILILTEFARTFPFPVRRKVHIKNPTPLILAIAAVLIPTTTK
jgi:hypothetical protein